MSATPAEVGGVWPAAVCPDVRTGIRVYTVTHHTRTTHNEHSDDVHMVHLNNLSAHMSTIDVEHDARCVYVGQKLLLRHRT